VSGNTSGLEVAVAARRAAVLAGEGGSVRL